MTNYKSKLLVGFISLCLLSIFSSYATAKLSPVDEFKQQYCSFNGILKDKSRWSEEFKMLEEPIDYPNFKAMSDLLSLFMTMPKDFIHSCPDLKSYLSELVKYHFGNEKIHKKVSDAIDFISKKLQNDPKNNEAK
jgi:hypothetical protein